MKKEISSERREAIGQFLKIHGVELVVQARRWAIVRGKLPQDGDKAVERALITLTSQHSPAPESLFLWFRREIWREI